MDFKFTGKQGTAFSTVVPEQTATQSRKDICDEVCAGLPYLIEKLSEETLQTEEECCSSLCSLSLPELAVMIKDAQERDQRIFAALVKAEAEEAAR